MKEFHIIVKWRIQEFPDTSLSVWTLNMLIHLTQKQSLKKR